MFGRTDKTPDDRDATGGEDGTDDRSRALNDPIRPRLGLAEGIGRPPDEMFAARCAAYAISQARRR